jgi:hypothetical protein
MTAKTRAAGRPGFVAALCDGVRRMDVQGHRCAARTVPRRSYGESTGVGDACAPEVRCIMMKGSVEVERIIRMRNKREGGRADRYLLTWTAARPAAFRRMHPVVSYPFHKAPWEALSRRGWVGTENREDT